jgi:hypothetical protein
MGSHTTISGQDLSEDSQYKINRLENQLEIAKESIKSNIPHIRRSKNVYLRCLLEKYRFQTFRHYTGQTRRKRDDLKIKQKYLDILDSEGYQPNYLYTEHHETIKFMEKLLEILVDNRLAKTPREHKLIDFSRGWPHDINPLKPYKRLSNEIHSANESNLRDVLTSNMHMELTSEELTTYREIFAEVYPSET